MHFAFIDNSIDDCNVPYAGPRGNWPGAARREEYADTQQALYSGYTHRHGIRVETCFRPDGICTVFGPVSARHHDVSVGAKLGRFTLFCPNFTQISRSVEVVGHLRDFGAILVRRHWHTYLFLLQPQES
jgi:hypothetical protein